MSTQPRIRIGIIGLGVISRFYVDALAGEIQDIELAAVCDLNEATLDPHRGTIPVFTDHRELLASTELDAVVVNVPNDVHYEVCRDALAAGVAVCVEKPLGITVQQGRALRDLAAEKGVALFTAYHRRYNTNVLDLLASLPADVPIERLTVRYWEKIEEHVGKDRWYLDPERCGGGCVADNGPNAIDVVHLFLGDDVVFKEASVGRDETGIDRIAVITLQSTEGVTAVVDLDWAYAHGERKDVEILLADGRVLTADMLAGYPAFKSSLAHEYVGVLREFGEVLRGERTSWPDGLATLELVGQVYAAESALTRG
ncbi:Gfo/Idh/MocA family protein [Streptomyces sp. NPDC057280]|jgi:predicted dehydrogenase|uniref:Gfo/Idh/MocA family protein n=1 Tax=Streptomyces sp. NPDC057280 TaxID=3346081 RepID=UPI0036282B57